MTIAFRIAVFTRAEVEKGQIEVVVIVFKSSTLQFTKGAQWFYNRENYPFPRIQRGPSFPRGSNLFQGGGPKANFYRNPYNLCFSSGGVQTPHPPLDPHMRISGVMFVCFDSLRPINNLSDIKGRVFLG